MIDTIHGFGQRRSLSIAHGFASTPAQNAGDLLREC